MAFTFLTLNGYTVAVANRAAGRAPTFRGSKNRAYLGQARDQTRGKRRQWSLKGRCEGHEDAQTLIGIINGYGHLAPMWWGFECQRTSLSPEVGDLTLVRLQRSLVPLAGFEPGAIRTEGDATFLRYHAQLPSEWTLHWRESEADLATWHWYTKRSDGGFWEDGIRDDTSWLAHGVGQFKISVEDGSVSLVGGGNDPIGVAHLAMLPYLASEAAIEAWGVATKPWGPLPVLRMEGSALVVDHTFVMGEVTNVDYLQVGSRDPDFGRITNNSEIVNFTLTEVVAGYVSDPVSVTP